jgi:hypothetical protein
MGMQAASHFLSGKPADYSVQQARAAQMAAAMAAAGVPASSQMAAAMAAVGAPANAQIAAATARFEGGRVGNWSWVLYIFQKGRDSPNPLFLYPFLYSHKCLLLAIRDQLSVPKQCVLRPLAVALEQEIYS